MARPKARTILASFVIGLSLFAYVYETTGPVIRTLNRPNDFGAYHDAARAIASGASPYTVVEYIYPPLLAFLLAPLARLDSLILRWIWYLLSQAASIASAFLVWRHLGKTLLAAGTVAVAWAICGASLSEALGLGQITPFLLLPFTAAYLSADRAAGAVVAIGTAIKVFPGILLPGMWIARERRRLLWAILSLGVLMAVPVLVLRAFWPPPYAPVNKTFLTGTPAVLNFSIAGIVLRSLDWPHRSQPLPYSWVYGHVVQELHLPIAHQLVSAAVLGFILLAAYALWATAPRSQFDLMIASLTCLSLAVSPVAWSHYYGLCAPGVAVIAAYALRLGRPWTAALAGLAACFTYRIPYWLLQWYATTYPWPSAGKYPVVWYLGTALGGLASLYLAMLAWWLAMRSPRSEPRPGG